MRIFSNNIIKSTAKNIINLCAMIINQISVRTKQEKNQAALTSRIFSCLLHSEYENPYNRNHKKV